MNQFKITPSQALNQVLGPISPKSPAAQPQAQAPAPAPNQAAFAGRLQPSQQNLLDPNLLDKPLNEISPQTLLTQASRVPRPQSLMSVGLNGLNDQELIGCLMRGENSQGQNRYSQPLREASELDRSCILQDLQVLAARKISVPESELNRSLEDDAVLVMTGFAAMSSEQITNLKKQAYQHPEVEPDRLEAVAKGYYGCNQHRQYGEIVEALTGGIISSEEAMAMNPSGGLPGPGMNEIPLIGAFDSVARHAMRHDATGFLLTRFGIGPGYGSPTTPLGLNNSNPLAGQILGIAREAFGKGSVLPSPKIEGFTIADV